LTIRILIILSVLPFDWQIRGYCDFPLIVTRYRVKAAENFPAYVGFTKV